MSPPARILACSTHLCLWLLAGVVSTSACTRDNPAFREASSGSDASSEDSEASDSVADSSTQMSSSADEGSSSEATDTASSGSDTGPDPLCMDIPPAYDFLIYFEHATNDVALSCSSYTGSYFYAAETTATELLMAGPCNEDCSACEDNELAMGFEPSGGGQEAETGDGTCVFVEAEAFIDDPSSTATNRCYFRRVTISPALFGFATPLLSISGDGAIPSALTQLPGPDGSPFSIERGTEAQCTCDDVSWCCEEDLPPTTYKLLPSGTDAWAYPGQTVEVEWNALVYEFINARSYDAGECDRPPSITWVLQMQDPMVSP